MNHSSHPHELQMNTNSQLMNCVWALLIISWCPMIEFIWSSYDQEKFIRSSSNSLASDDFVHTKFIAYTKKGSYISSCLFHYPTTTATPQKKIWSNTRSGDSRPDFDQVFDRMDILEISFPPLLTYHRVFDRYSYLIGSTTVLIETVDFWPELWPKSTSKAIVIGYCTIHYTIIFSDIMIRTYVVCTPPVILWILSKFGAPQVSY